MFPNITITHSEANYLAISKIIQTLISMYKPYFLYHPFKESKVAYSVNQN